MLAKIVQTDEFSVYLKRLKWFLRKADYSEFNQSLVS